MAIEQETKNIPLRYIDKPYLKHIPNPNTSSQLKPNSTQKYLVIEHHQVSTSASPTDTQTTRKTDIHTDKTIDTQTDIQTDR